MVEYRVLKRTVLLLGALVGCVCAFTLLLAATGTVLLRADRRAVFTLVDKNQYLQLPFYVEDSRLLVSALVSYEGPFLESGSDDPVSDITALLLYNAGQQEIAQVEIRLLAGEEELTFFASNIMPGMQVLVLEKNAAPWSSRQIESCTAWINEALPAELPADALQLRQVDMGTLALTNTTGETLNDIWIYHKNYLPDSDLYVGGITYLSTVLSIKPGQTVYLAPSHYASGYSKIIKIEMHP